MKRIVWGTIAALCMIGCSADVVETTKSEETKPKTQTEELNSYLSLGQNMEEPKQVSDEMSSKGNIKNNLTISIPLPELSQSFRAQGIPKVGDTIKTEKGVNVIIKSTSKFPVIGILVEKVYTAETDVVEPNKTLTGLGWWEGAVAYDIFAKKATATEINRWGYKGMERRNWSGRIFEDSLIYQVTYTDSSIESLTPGNSTLWAKCLFAPNGIGIGDTARITVDSLDDVKHIQYGKGSMYSKSLDRTFRYDFELIHRNEENPASPYEKYRYNQAVVKFSIPMTSAKVDFKSLNVAIFYHVDRDKNGTADLYERDVILTNEKGDTVAVAKGNVKTGVWDISKKEPFFPVN